MRPIPRLSSPVVTLVFASAALAQTVPAGFTREQFATTSPSPTVVEQAPDGRIFVARQTGPINVYADDGAFLATYYTFPVTSGAERGLIGMCLAPDFPTTGEIFVHYSQPTSPARAAIARVAALAPSDNSAPAGSAVILAQFDPLGGGIHNGGAIRFGPDGKLYVAIGDSGSSSNSQSATTRHGKILRYNRDGTIPQDNPQTLAGIAAAPQGDYRAIWAAGLRNPFNMAFQPGTGRLFINDVGAGSREEINQGLIGRNYGWPATEGDFDQAAYPNFTRPVFAYPRSGGPVTGNVITGGGFYNPPQHSFPAVFDGAYLFADAGAGWIKRLDPATGAVSDFCSGFNSLYSLSVDRQGRLLAVTGNGRVHRISFTGALPPFVLAQPANAALVEGQLGALSVRAGGKQNLTYRWRKDNQDLFDTARITGAATARLEFSHVRPWDAGSYSVHITGPDGETTTNPAALTVTPIACSAADVATSGSPDPLRGPDGFLTGDDFDAFLTAFFDELRWDNNALIADLTDGAGIGPPDELLTGADFDRFIQLFFDGC